MEVSGRLHASAALPMGKNPGPHWREAWVGQAGRFRDEKNLFPLLEFEPRIVPPMVYTVNYYGYIALVVDEWIRSNDGIMLTAKNRSTATKTCPSAILYTANPTWTDLGPKVSLCGQRPATLSLSRGTTKQIYICRCIDHLNVLVKSEF
jgi:hypothetical protein